MKNDPVCPHVGDGATFGCGSDRYPYTVIEVRRDGRELVLQADDYKRTDSNGFSESQEYEYTPNTNGGLVVVTLRKDGRYIQKGDSLKGMGYSIGHRAAYSDPCF